MNASRRSFVKGAGVTTVGGAVGTIVYRSHRRRTPARPTALVAGSLLPLAKEVPGATIEAHGSATVRRMIVNDMRDPDAVALADPLLFVGISRRATMFATNALVLAYDPSSAFAPELKQDWTAAVQDEDVRLGRTDPQADPLGYRTVLALRLAERLYDVDARLVLENALIFPETGLMNVVEGGAIDAAFTYRNMAVQRDLPHVPLPDEVNFSNPDYADSYRSVSWNLGGRVIRGAPIQYGATALTPTGEQWTENLVTATELLRENGFVVPPGYPIRDRVVPTTQSVPATKG